MKTSAYAPLQGSRSIRLLSLSPSRDATAKLRCTIEAVSLDDRPIYEALSWKWGTAANTETILLNGLQHNVRKGLAEALRHYRPVDEPRLLWVDAICINQADLLERSLQICLMRDIYRTAVIVQVWLGPMLSKSSLDVFPVFEAMAQGFNIRQLYHQQVVGGIVPLISEEDFEETYAPDDTSWRWNATVNGIDRRFLENLLKFFNLGWWNRLWVLQEVVVARTVLLRWGINIIALTTLLKAHDLMRTDLEKHYHITARTFGNEELEDYLDSVAKSLEPINYLRGLQSAAEHADTKSREQEVYGVLIETLALCRTRDTSDSRDKIYGLLGMLPAEVSVQTRPSYLQPEKTVFSGLACLILRKTKSFMLFGCLVSDEDTWIPDWTRPCHQFNDFHARVNQQQLFSAGAGAEWELHVAADNVLHHKGIRIDELAYVKRFYYDPTDANFVHDMIREWSQCLWESRSQFSDSNTTIFKQVREYVRHNKYPDGSMISDATCRTVLNDCVPLTECGKLARAQDRDWQDVQDWIDYMDSFGVDEQVAPSIMAHSEGLRFRNGYKGGICKTIRNNIRGRDFFHTKTGYMGLVPDEPSKPGDEVWILAGASHPVILRLIDRESKTYKAVTEAYMQGIMDGEISRGQCPILPSDGNAEPIRRQCAEGRTSWPIPQWASIRIL